jgi:antitoxin PrlF
MAAATLTSKWQITIPAVVRDSLHLGAGDRLEFIQMGEGRFEVIAANRDISQLKGLIKTSKVATLEEMEAAIQQGIEAK